MNLHEHPRSVCGACCTRFDSLSVSREGLDILENISTHLHCGQLTAIIGPNGAGKTTLVKALLGLIPYKGSISFSDAEGKRTGKPRIGYVPQFLDMDPMAPLTVCDFFSAALFRSPSFLPPSAKKRASVSALLQRVKAEALIDRRLGTLSGGEKQRVLMALALSPMPNLLLLDEPVSGMDIEGLAAFYHTLDDLRNSYDVSILLISHDFPFVRRYADRVILLNRRILAHGTPDEVFASEYFQALFPEVQSAEVAQ